MLYHATDGVLTLRNGEMEYVRFGSGKKTLIMLPGLGDALRTMKGTAKPVAFMYRLFAKDFTVYMFSRKRVLSEGYTTRDMARDQAEAMDLLGISKAHIFGVSMGGMIAQHLASDYPEKVEKLILVVTAARSNPIMEESIAEWLDFAKMGDHTAFMDSNLRRIYSPTYYQKNKKAVPLLGRVTKPKSYDRLFVQAQACLEHNAFDALEKIKATTLVIGGEQDLTLGGDASREIAAKIPNAVLRMYPQWGHGLYEEEKTFNQVVFDFLMQ